MLFKPPKASSAASSTVNLSNASVDKYTADQNNIHLKKTALNQASNESAEKTEKNDSAETDPVSETLLRLQKMLKEAQQRLNLAQQKMTQAMTEQQNASNESERIAGTMKIQEAQTLVVSSQGEVLAIHAQINKIIQEQQKAANGSSSS